MEHSTKSDELGWMKWILLAGVLVLAIWSLVSWPVRIIVERWPGRRERLLHKRVEELRSAIPSAMRLVEILGQDSLEVKTKATNKFAGIQKKLDKALAERKRSDELDVQEPWAIAIDLLEKIGKVGGIDHRSAPDELQKAMKPLLNNLQIGFDWSFLQDLEHKREFDTLKNENLLPIVAERLASIGLVLAQIDEGSDNYLFTICTPDQFKEIEPLTDGGYSIRRFEKKPGNATRLTVES